MVNLKSKKYGLKGGFNKSKYIRRRNSKKLNRSRKKKKSFKRKHLRKLIGGAGEDLLVSAMHPQHPRHMEMYSLPAEKLVWGQTHRVSSIYISGGVCDQNAYRVLAHLVDILQPRDPQYLFGALKVRATVSKEIEHLPHLYHDKSHWRPTLEAIPDDALVPYMMANETGTKLYGQDVAYLTEDLGLRDGGIGGMTYGMHQMAVVIHPVKRTVQVFDTDCHIDMWGMEFEAFKEANKGWLTDAERGPTSVEFLTILPGISMRRRSMAQLYNRHDYDAVLMDAQDNDEGLVFPVDPEEYDECLLDPWKHHPLPESFQALTCERLVDVAKEHTVAPPVGFVKLR